jgi:hypothetical protein
MGGKKQTQQTTQNQSFNNTSTYGWQTPPDTADIAAMRGFEFAADPRVGHSFARTRRNLADTYHSPTGAYSTPGLRDAQYRVNLEDLGQEEAQALREENYARQGLEYAKRADVASLTQPRMVQESSSGTGSSTGNSTIRQTESPLSSIIQGGSAIGSALIM